MRRIARSLRQLTDQDIARSNAAEALSTLMNHRRDREEVEAYLRARGRPQGASPHAARRLARD